MSKIIDRSQKISRLHQVLNSGALSFYDLKRIELQLMCLEALMDLDELKGILEEGGDFSEEDMMNIYSSLDDAEEAATNMENLYAKAVWFSS